MDMQDATDLGFTKGKQIGCVNAGDVLNVGAWVGQDIDSADRIVEIVDGGALIFEAIPPKAT